MTEVLMFRFLVVLAVAGSAGCVKKQPQNVTSGPPVQTAGPAVTQQQAIDALVDNFSKVHFATDSASLDAGGQAALTENARILRDHGQIKVEVQGHADERGTIDYNLALGQRRANAVVDYLVSQGVAPSRLPIVSYGEERPAASGSTEVAWAENRRAEFRVIGGEGVQGTTTN
jgi:peptidoglycan-associated lipoprotein